jgi:hypothetical protein
MSFLRAASLRALPLVTLSVASLLWGGCGDGSPSGIDPNPDDPPGDTLPTAPDTTPAAPSGTVVGTVNKKEIGGAGLKIFSASDTSVSGQVQDSTFQTVVADSSAQLVFALDEGEALRGLALTIPDSSGAAGNGSQGQLRVDAESTAMSLLFLTPGILATTPDVAEERASELRSYSCFQPLVDHLRSALPTRSLNSLTAEDHALEDLLTACVMEWIDSHPVPGTSSSMEGQSLPVRASTKEGGVILDAQTFTKAYFNGQFRVDIVDSTIVKRDGLPILVGVRDSIQNSAFRFVQIYRQDIPITGEEEWEAIASNRKPHKPGIPWLLGGMTGMSWGSLFTLSFTDPSTMTDDLLFRRYKDPKDPGSEYWVKTAKYWFLGPGYTLPGHHLPNTMPPDYHDASLAWGATTIMYIVLPAISVAAAGISRPEDLKSRTDALVGLWRHLDKLGLGPELHALMTWKGSLLDPEYLKKYKKFVVDVFTSIAFDDEALKMLQELGGYSAALGSLGKAVGHIGVAFALSNVVMALSVWNRIPAFGSYRVRGLGDRYTITVSPEEIETGLSQTTIRVLMEDVTRKSRKWDRQVRFEALNEKGSLRLPDGEEWDFFQYTFTDTLGFAEVHYRSSSPQESVDSIRVAMFPPGPGEEILMEDTVTVTVTDTLDGYTVYTLPGWDETRKPQYRVFGIEKSICEGDQDVNYWSKNIFDGKPGWTFLGEGETWAQTFKAEEGHGCVIVGTHSGVEVDAIRFPNGKHITLAKNKLGHYVFKPDGVGVSNIHKPYSFESWIGDDGKKKCTIEPGEYGYFDKKTGELINSMDFTGKPDKKADELGIPPECLDDPEDKRVFHGFFLLPAIVTGGQEGTAADSHPPPAR